MKNNINQNPEHKSEQQSPKKANIGKTAAVAALLTLGGVASGQNAATIDPINYKTAATAFVIPSLPSGSAYSLKIKTGGAIYLTIDGADANSIVGYLSAPTRTRTGNPIKLEAGDVGPILINYTINGANKSLALTVNYQADIYGPKGDRPDAVIVDPGQTARLSGGPNMKRYARKNIETGSIIGNTATDSVKNVSRGTYIANLSDGSGNTNNRSKDTIAVIERPVANTTAGRLDFSTTVAGVTYKIYKGEKVGNDTVWTEVSTFVGNGNPTNINTGFGDFRIGAIRRAGADVVEAKDEKTFKVDFGTEVYEMREKPEPTFVVNGRTLYFKEDVKYQIIDMSGRIIKTGKGNMESVPQAGSYIVLIEKANGKQIHEKFIISK